MNFLSIMQNPPWRLSGPGFLRGQLWDGGSRLTYRRCMREFPCNQHLRMGREGRSRTKRDDGLPCHLSKSPSRPYTEISIWDEPQSAPGWDKEQFIAHVWWALDIGLLGKEAWSWTLQTEAVIHIHLLLLPLFIHLHFTLIFYHKDDAKNCAKRKIKSICWLVTLRKKKKKKTQTLRSENHLSPTTTLTH